MATMQGKDDSHLLQETEDTNKYLYPKGQQHHEKFPVKMSKMDNAHVIQQ